MADYPDIYADGIGVTVGPFGVTITLQLSQPILEEGPHIDANLIVGRVRMDHALAKALAQGLNDAVAQHANVQQSEMTVRH